MSLQAQQRRCVRPARRRWRIRLARSLVEAGLEGLQDVGLGVVAHGDDEGKAELRDIGVVQRWEVCALGVGQGVEPGGGLFGGGFGGQPLAPAPACRQGRGGRCSTPRRSSSLAARNTAAQRVVQADGAVMGGAKFQVEGALGDPGRMFEDAAEVLHEIGARPCGWAAVRGAVRMGLAPMAGDVDAARQPDPVVLLHIVEEALQRRRCGPAGRSGGSAGRCSSSWARPAPSA